MNEQELLVRLREAFQIESRERLTAIGLELIALEQELGADQRQAAMERVYREAHSLKGAARAVNFKEVESVCQGLEGALASLKRGEITVSAELFDAVHGAVSLIERLLGDRPATEPRVSHEEIVALVAGLERHSRADGELAPATPRPAVNSATPAATPKPEAATAAGPAARQPLAEGPAPSLPPGPPVELPVARAAPPPAPGGGLPAGPLAGSVRVATAKMDKMLLQAEELISLKLTGNQHLLEIKEAQQTFELWRKKVVPANAAWRSLRKKVPTVLSGFGQFNPGDLQETDKFLDWSQEYFKVLTSDMRTLAKRMSQHQRSLDRMVDELLDSVKQMLMLPSATLLNLFPLMVREIARAQGKEVDFQLLGGEVEVDRRILEEMKDPLTHLLRNALDHGLEPPSVRRQQGKEARGVIRLAIVPHEGDKVEIRIADDGAGVNLEQIKASAIRAGVVTREEAEELGEREAAELIFHSGVSSAAMITELSGRGLGMAIVQEKVEKLGGLLDLTTIEGRGTEISIRLPVSLASFRGVLVRADRHLFIIPSMQVDSVVQVVKNAVRMAENRPTFLHKAIPLSLVDLGSILGVASRERPEEEKLQVAVLGQGEKRVGFRVDEVLGEQEVLVKSLGSQLRKVRHLAGATILGTGKVVPILMVKELLESAAQTAAVGRAPLFAEEGGKAARKSILVVEDSITSRILLKNILEAAGYLVFTAIDGIDGLTFLRTTPVDLVISDVEMPRMNGFELTEQIRAEAGLAHLPLILVTSLASREDRERGVEAGANAYIIKSDFDQGNLLEVVARLA